MTAQDKALKENTASAPLQIVAPGTCVETGEQATLVGRTGAGKSSVFKQLLGL